MTEFLLQDYSSASGLASLDYCGTGFNLVKKEWRKRSYRKAWSTIFDAVSNGLVSCRLIASSRLLEE